MTAKEFPTLVVASTITGVTLCRVHASEMDQVANYLFGAPVRKLDLTHEPKAAYVQEGYCQFPDMPTREEAQADWEAAARKAVAAYGETVTVQQGTHGRRESPAQTLETKDSEVRP